MQRPVLDGDTYRYGTVLVRRGAVLEGVLDKRDEDHGRNLHVMLVGLHVELDVRVVVQAQRLQVDILSYVVYLAADGNRQRRGVGVHVLEYVRELHECRLGLVGLGYHQTVERIERVEQEMGVYLRLVQRQFGLVLLGLDLLPRYDLAEELYGEFYRKAEARHDKEEKPHSLPPYPLTGVDVEHRVAVDTLRLREFAHECCGKYHQQKDQQHCEIAAPHDQRRYV